MCSERGGKGFVRSPDTPAESGHAGGANRTHATNPVVSCSVAGRLSKTVVHMSQCIDPIVGKILAGWRYDISGLAAEMGSDYEEHFASCEHCRSRQRLHRTIDISLIVLASVSAGVFLLAFGVIRHFGPRNAFWLEIAALVGFALSALIWLIVAVATPAPMAVVDVAMLGARHVHDRLPAEIRERLPEELRLKITGS